jgi:hypothetical protein
LLFPKLVERSGMSNVFGRRAVVVGGGIGGSSVRWIVTIAGRGATARLETWDSFLAALSRLITPTLYDALRHAKPSGAIRHYGFPASYWRHGAGRN